MAFRAVRACASEDLGRKSILYRCQIEVVEMEIIQPQPRIEQAIFPSRWFRRNRHLYSAPWSCQIAKSRGRNPSRCDPVRLDEMSSYRKPAPATEVKLVFPTIVLFGDLCRIAPHISYLMLTELVTRCREIIKESEIGDQTEFVVGIVGLVFPGAV